MERRRLPSARPPAPAFEIAPREVVAVEHPAIIKNLDNAVKTFGRNQPFERVSLSLATPAAFLYLHESSLVVQVP
jgi:hypothetical protein